MARNVEIKARIANLEALEARIAIVAEKGPAEIVQDDMFFNCNQGRLKLRRFPGGHGELIFYQRADKSGPKESFYLISTTREPDKLREVLSQAYGSCGRVKKQRMLYFSGRTRIHVDRVENLGDFLELEVVLEEKDSLETGFREARSILADLGVEDEQLVEGAYVDLLEKSDA